MDNIFNLIQQRTSLETYLSDGNEVARNIELAVYDAILRARQNYEKKVRFQFD